MMPHLMFPADEQDHSLGSPESPAILVEYGDYQCGICKICQPMLKKLKKELGDQLCVIFRHFPLTQSHPFARLAAQAAEAASLQNKFWEMHELLYDNQLRMEPGLFNQLAEQLKLDMKKFKSDLQSPQIAAKIDTDFNGGLRSGVNGSPCFFINQERYDGDASYDVLKKALIESAKS